MTKTFLSALILLFASFAPGSAGAAQSSRLSMYSAFGEGDNLVLFQAFQRDTGIRIRHVRLGAGEILTRLQAEAGNPQVSVWLGGAVDSFTRAANADLFRPYQSENIGNIPKERRVPGNLYTPISIGTIALISSRPWLDENRMKAPTSWAELVTPPYSGNVCMAHPATSGSAYTAFSTILQLFGKEAGFEYLKKLDKNIVQYTKAGSAPIRLAGLGETGVAIAYNMDAGVAIEEGYPLVVTYPSEGTGYEVTCVGIIKNGPADEVHNAQRFIDWLLTKRAQTIISQQLFRIPLNSDAPSPDGIPRMSEVKTIDYDSAWSAENKTRLVERFEREVRSASLAR